MEVGRYKDKSNTFLIEYDGRPLPFTTTNYEYMLTFLVSAYLQGKANTGRMGWFKHHNLIYRSSNVSTENCAEICAATAEIAYVQEKTNSHGLLTFFKAATYADCTHPYDQSLSSSIYIFPLP